MANIDDWRELHDLYARYAAAIDEGRYEEWVALFTKDGVFASPRFGRHAGRDGLRRFTAVYKESLGGARVRHMISNVLVEIDGDRASGSCALSYFHTQGGKSELAALGGYRDRMRKVDGRWRFESRQVVLDGG